MDAHAWKERPLGWTGSTGRRVIGFLDHPRQVERANDAQEPTP